MQLRRGKWPVLCKKIEDGHLCENGENIIAMVAVFFELQVLNMIYCTLIFIPPHQEDIL